MQVTAQIEDGMLVIRVPLSAFCLPGEVRLTPRLTPRESEVMDLLSAGRCDKEIAQVMSRSVSAVKHHVGALLKKFGVRSRQELVIARLTKAAADSIVSAHNGVENHYGDDAPQL